MKFLKSSKTSHLSDEELISRYKLHDSKEMVEILFDRYSHLAFAISLNYLKDEEEARDVVLTIFGNLQNDLQKYQIDNFGGWIYSVIKNHCFRLLRKKKLKVEATDNLPDSADEESDFSFLQIEQLPSALNLLNSEQRLCIELFYLKELSYQQISDETGFDYKQVKTYIQNGKRNLKIILEREAPHE